MAPYCQQLWCRHVNSLVCSWCEAQPAGGGGFRGDDLRGKQGLPRMERSQGPLPFRRRYKEKSQKTRYDTTTSVPDGDFRFRARRRVMWGSGAGGDGAVL